MEVMPAALLGLLLGLAHVLSCVGTPLEGSVVPGALAEFHTEGGNLRPSLQQPSMKMDSNSTAVEGTVVKSPSTPSLLSSAENASLEISGPKIVPASEAVGQRNVSVATALKGKGEEQTSSLVDGELRPTHIDFSNHSKYKIDVPSPAPVETSTVPPIKPRTESSKKKSKPGLTFDADDVSKDANGKPILTKEDLEESGPAYDYVVLIVIAMLAIPIVAVLGAFLYKKGRDFWDRRHYRRMDFLIDGMYND